MTVYSREPGYVIAVAGRYVLQIVRDRLNSTAISLTRRALADLAERHDKFGYLGVIEPAAQLLMPSDIRAGVDAYVKRYSERFTGAAVVFERTGFQATAVRSIVTAINFAARANHPTHVFSDVQEAISWVSKLTPGEPTAARLLQICRQLRSNPSLVEG